MHVTKSSHTLPQSPTPFHAFPNQTLIQISTVDLQMNFLTLMLPSIPLHPQSCRSIPVSIPIGNYQCISITYSFEINDIKSKRLSFLIGTDYRKVTSSRPVYYSSLELFCQRSQYISIKFSLHKPSENLKMCH